LEDCWRPDLSPAPDVARAEHGEVAKVLADAGADILLCETFAHEGEAAIAVEAAARTGKETWVALTAGPEGNLLTPEGMRDVARSCVRAGATVVLVNCTPPEQTESFLAALDVDAITGCYANDGSLSVDEYVQHARSWIARGAQVIGSCCGTGPSHILEMHREFVEGKKAP
jgi:S-methylmethionine-dependent homocysteine/selenocysteine methylase